MFINQINQTKKSSLSVYAFVDLTLIFPFNVILMRIRHIEIDKKHFNFLKMAWKNSILLDKIWMVDPNAWLKNGKNNWLYCWITSVNRFYIVRCSLIAKIVPILVLL